MSPRLHRLFLFSSPQEASKLPYHSYKLPTPFRQPPIRNPSCNTRTKFHVPSKRSLSWDSGSEAVKTMSVVYTSDKGVSTLLAEKNIGEAGSGGGDERGGEEGAMDSKIPI